MKKLLVIIILMVIFLSFILTSCTSSEPYVYNNYQYFGTNLKAVMYTSKYKFSKWTAEAESMLENLSVTLDETIENSDINRFNNAIDGQLVEINVETYNLVNYAKEIYSLTQGAYNPAVYYLVDLWGFSTRFSLNKSIKEVYDRQWVNADSSFYLPLPDTKYVEGFIALSDFDKIKLSIEGGKYYLVKESTEVTIDGISYYAKIDLGGLVKGYAVDKLIQIANSLEITRGYINYGTSSIALLKNGTDENWDLTLTNPRYTNSSESEVYLKMQLMDSYISSSGDYEKYYEIDNVRYSHIIDGKTGAPINNNVCSVTVLSNNACLSDMLSTAICVMGKDKAKEFMESEYCKQNNIKVILSYNTGDKIEVITSSNVSGVTICDNNFYLGDNL